METAPLTCRRIIIGAGVSGVAMGYKLKSVFGTDDFEIL